MLVANEFWSAFGTKEGAEWVLTSEGWLPARHPREVNAALRGKEEPAADKGAPGDYEAYLDYLEACARDSRFSR